MPAAVPHADETKEMLRVMWNDGMSATQVGLALGLSRNAVIGIVNRCRARDGVAAWPFKTPADGRDRKKAKPSRKPTKARTAPKRSKRSLIPAKPKRAPVPPPGPIARPIGTIDWSSRSELSQCAYIEGEVNAATIGSLQCCGAPTEFGSSWCKYHRFIVYGADVTSKEAKSFRLSRIGVGG